MGLRFISATKIMLPFSTPYRRFVMHAVSAQPGVDGSNDILPYSSWSGTVVGSSAITSLLTRCNADGTVALDSFTSPLTINCTAAPVGFVLSLIPGTSGGTATNPAQVPYIYCETLNSAYNPITVGSGTLTLNLYPVDSFNTDKIFHFKLASGAPTVNGAALTQTVSGSPYTGQLVTSFPSGQQYFQGTTPVLAPWFYNYGFEAQNTGRPSDKLRINSLTLGQSSYTSAFSVHWRHNMDDGISTPLSYPRQMVDFGGPLAMKIETLSDTQIRLTNFNGPGLSPILTVPLSRPGQIDGNIPHRYSLYIDRDNDFYAFYYDPSTFIYFDQFLPGQFWDFGIEPTATVRDIECIGNNILNFSGYPPIASKTGNGLLFVFKINGPSNS